MSSIFPEGHRPAFPIVVSHNGTTEWRNGLTRRELFAAMAMQAFLSSGVWHDFFQETARISTKHADALIAELDKC